jgi:hypothetical protein
MKHILTNWKTTIAGLATIIVSLLASKGKLDAQTATAITSGIGLIVAADPQKKEDGQQ